MQPKLTKLQIEYIFYHLNHHFDFNYEIKKRIVFDRSALSNSPNIFFPLSDESYSLEKNIEDCTILFPLSRQKFHYLLDNDNNLIFSDDLLKSAFYLLSGYQELQNFEPDEHGRFTFEQSIQKKLDIAEYPLVNGYFEIIIQGIEKFCEANHINFVKRKLWDDKNFGFLLTHDVDRIDKYTFKDIKLRIKQLLGITESNSDKNALLQLLIRSIFKYFGNDNPYWNFDWMKSIENKYGFRSVWFFLPQGDKNIDAHYSFDEIRIRNLAADLLKNGDEIGLHATYHSMDNENILKKDYESVRKLLGKFPYGNRQHWLRVKYPETLLNLEKVGIKYDSSLGFNDRIGWRNSYCFPFKPYDLKNDRMINIWEFPLAVMDVSLFEYQEVSRTEAMKKIKEMILVCERFGGLFNLLWHNSKFELENGDSLKEFYTEILEFVSKKNFASILPGLFIKKDYLNV